ncbi:protein SRG1 [Gossypium australe]|uniref:Protein SRG1 n=1 Tax=Gossypium australe TaxID=47621 RepID=A0A5B6WTY7_9ROSI|nr:protein SRG1 [Gossypium australe]
MLPRVGETLYLYLETSNETMAAILIRTKGVYEVYYVSKVLQDGEKRYSKTKKLFFSLIVAARKLRPYFQVHLVTVMTNQPIKDILSKVDTSGKMTKSPDPTDIVVSLSQGQTSSTMKPKCWTVYVDGSIVKMGLGAGFLLIDPNENEW